jgi:E3 ubiquitin-protein ligase BRE1
MRSKEADVLRLRQQRDVLQNDLDAKRTALAQRFDHANAMQALAEKREERLQVLSSEVKRIRSKLAANMGKEEMLEYLLDGAQASYVDSLEEQLK